MICNHFAGILKGFFLFKEPKKRITQSRETIPLSWSEKKTQDTAAPFIQILLLVLALWIHCIRDAVSWIYCTRDAALRINCNLDVASLKYCILDAASRIYCFRDAAS